MKKIFIILLLLMVSSLSAQDTIVQHSLNGRKRAADMNTTYHRSSWYNLLIYHDDQKYAEEILATCIKLPISEFYTDRDLDDTIRAFRRVVEWYQAQ